MDRKHLETIKANIDTMTWLDLHWLPEDCPEGYPDDPKTYQVSDNLLNALQTLKEDIYSFIEKNYDILIAMYDHAQRSETIYYGLEERIDKVAGEFGATDTASREALMYRLDFEVF